MYLIFVVFFLWSFSSYIVSKFVVNVPPFFAAFIIVIISFFIQTIFYLIHLRKRNNNKINNYSIKSLSRLIVPAITGLCIYPILYFIGIGGSSPLQANVLNYFWPFFAVVTQSILMKKMPTKIEICALGLGLTGSLIITFLSSEMKFTINMFPYLLFSFFGAVSYGFYTGIIGATIPKAKNDNKDITHSIRFYVMTFFSVVSFCFIFLIISLLNFEWVKDSLFHIKNNITKETVVYILIYAFLNFTIAHYLWNRVNYENKAIYTSTLAFCIPFCSTIILSFLSGNSLNSSIVLGLTFILIGITIINWRYTSNAVSMAILIVSIFLITLITIPFVSDINIIDKSYSLMQILIALYAIYYSFLVFRVNSDYKELQKNIDSVLVFKAGKGSEYNSVLIEIDKFITDSPAKWASDKISHEKIINIIYKQRDDYQPDDNIAATYLQILHLSQKSLTRSEWAIILILTISIIFLSFIMRENITSLIIASVICCSSVFCDFILFNEERKKKNILDSFLKKFK